MVDKKRLIVANEAIKQCERHSDYTAWSIKDGIEAIPTVDAVEMAEYDAIVSKLENLLCHATGGMYSKAGYSWEDMERMVTDYIEECCEEAIAEAVVHGRWETVPSMLGYLRCSQCKDVYIWETWPGDGKWNYCPNCGAHMDAEEA